MYLIMLDTDEIKEISKKSELHNYICNSKDFWIAKFHYDRVMLNKPYPETLDDWITRYNDNKKIKEKC